MASFWRELLPTFGGSYGLLLVGIIAIFWRELWPTFGGNYCQILAGVIANFWRENAKSLHVVSVPELSVLWFGGIIVHRSVLWVTPISHIEKYKWAKIYKLLFYLASDHLESMCEGNQQFLGICLFSQFKFMCIFLSHAVIRFVWVTVIFGTCTVVSVMGYLLKLKCAHSPLNQRILSSTNVPFTLMTEQEPNLGCCYIT